MQVGGAAIPTTIELLPASDPGGTRVQTVQPRPGSTPPPSPARDAGSASMGRASDVAVFYGQRNLEWTWVKNTPRALLWRGALGHLLYDIAGFAARIANAPGSEGATTNSTSICASSAEGLVPGGAISVCRISIARF